MKKIAIIGAGGFGREVKMLIDQINHNEKQYEFIGFYDDNVESETIINGFKVLGSINELLQIDYNLELVISIADPKISPSYFQPCARTILDVWIHQFLQESRIFHCDGRLWLRCNCQARWEVQSIRQSPD